VATLAQLVLARPMAELIGLKPEGTDA